MLAFPRIAASPTRLCKERRRNVAAVRRKLRQNLIAASRCTAPGDCLAAAEPVKNAASSTNSQRAF
jgi:hypothetical protein